MYLTKEDAFFFQLVYDPLQKTLQADRGQIREGVDYQADVPQYIPPDPTGGSLLCVMRVGVNFFVFQASY